MEHRGDPVDDVDEIVQEFLVESHENLDRLDRDLVALEQEPDSRELLSSVFRTIHTIKGTSGFLAFSQLEAVTHVGENLLSQLRDGVRRMTPQTTDVLLQMVDVVRALLAAIETTGGEGDVPVDEVVALVGALLAGEEPVQAEPENQPESESQAGPEPEAAAAQPAQSADADDLAAPAGKTTTRKSPLKNPAKSPAKNTATSPAASIAPADEAAVTSQDTPAAQVPVPPAVPVAGAPAADQASAATAADQVVINRPRVGENSIRVDVDLLDALMRLVGELVLTRNQVVQHASALHDVTLLRASQRLNLITSELQEGVMKTRMQPIDHIWSKFPRVVRDLSVACAKQVRLDMHGRDTELDRTLLDAVKDPLTHLVRNAVDHGVETPEARVAAGKPAEGVLSLRAFHEGGHVVVEVTDDGAGIDPARILAKAVERGLITSDQAGRMGDEEILQLVFQAGFSTAEAVTNVSGRGVGMDVVRTNIEKIGGTVGVDSRLGGGTTWRLTIPLTLAIAQVLTVECNGDRYAIPQASVQELVTLSEHTIEHVSGAPVHRLRGRLLPLVRLADALGLQDEAAEGGGCIVVLSVEGRRFGLVVDRVLTTEEIVVKPLSSRLKGLGVYGGATILGDGEVALILDAPALARHSLPLAELAQQASTDNDPLSQPGEDGDRLLLVGIGDRRLGIPLDSVTRLERFHTSDIERVGTREVVQYRDEILPVARLAQLLGSYEEDGGTELHAVVHTERGRSVALVVGEILDVVEADLVRSDLGDTGLTGSAVVQKRVTELLDVRQAILAADPRFYIEHTADALDESAMYAGTGA
jgi:two-component system chemotaxis sensor kinase CheA